MERKREEGKSSDKSEDGLKRPTKQSEESKRHGKFQRKDRSERKRTYDAREEGEVVVEKRGWKRKRRA